MIITVCFRVVMMTPSRFSGRTRKVTVQPRSPFFWDAPGIFRGAVDDPAGYRLRATAADGNSWEFDDAYRFGPVLGEMDEYLIGEGTHARLWDVLGAHVREHEGVSGHAFRGLGAQCAARVGRGRLQCLGRAAASDAETWRVGYLGNLPARDRRRRGLQVRDRRRGRVDSAAEGRSRRLRLQHPPENASVVRDIRGYGWHDGDWMAARAAQNDRSAPISIYEVHLGSWRRKDGGRPISYREAAEELVDYVADMGFTHIELMPVSEYPFDGSWGYQPVGLFAPTIRHGPPHEFRDLVDAAHQKGLGVILDWVPGHFPTDPHGLGWFDGTALYEHADPREGFHQDWNTLIYNYGRTEVKNFLVSNARTGWRNTTSTACAWMPWPRCSTATTPARRANGSRTRMAAARTTRPSPCCRR
jgi:1,4-alpha-glucan branching enzyme